MSGAGWGASEGTVRPPPVHTYGCSEVLLGYLHESPGEQELGLSPKPGHHLHLMELVRRLSDILEKSWFVWNISALLQEASS